MSTLTPELIAALNGRRTRSRRAHSHGDARDRLLADLSYAGLPPPEVEYRFHPVRRWALDLCWPDRRLAVEIEGLVYSNRGDNQLSGRHVSVTGFIQDLDKYNELACLGWRLLRVTSAQARNGMALTWIERALGRPAN